MMSGRRNRFPFTATQWEELQHQALIFKYMVSGIPIPPDLLFTIKRSSNLQHIGWNCFEMRMGRKVDPEPGRCRRTDGKKWRCSKQAYADSKYCERHMHRGKNRSRKPVEPTATTMANPSTATQSLSLSLSSSETQKDRHELRYLGYHSQLHDPFMYPPASRALGIGLSLQEKTTHCLLDSSSYPQTNKDYRLEQKVDEPSGTTRSFPGSSKYDDSWQLTPLTMSFSSSKQRNSLQLQNSKQNKLDDDDEACYVLESDIKCEMPIELDKREPKRTVHRFLDEWPPKQRDSWLDLDDKSSNSSSASTTRLSISISSTLHDFPIFNSRSDNGS